MMNNNAIKKVLMFGMFFFILPCFSQSDEYIIVQENFTITGRTNEKDLVAEFGQITGKRFASQKDVETFVNARLQKMENLRSFKEVKIETAYAEPQLHLIEVTLHTTVVDGFPVIPIPYGAYSSNLGFMAGIFVMLPNIAGSMQNLIIMGMYIAPPNEQDALQWTAPNINTMFLLSNIRLGIFKLSVSGFFSSTTQTIEMRGEPMVKSKLFFASTTLGLSYDITDKLINTVSLSGRKGFNTSLLYVNNPHYLHYGPLAGSVSVRNTITYNGFDWVGNFRQGIAASGTVGYTANFPEYAGMRNDFSITAFVAYYGILAKILNPTVRVVGMYNSDLPSLNTASYVRGIKDRELAGNIAFFINVDLHIKLFKIGKLEVLFSPNVDYAFVYAFNTPDYNAENGFAVGAELYLIADAMKSMPIKIGFAYDLRPKYGSQFNRRYEIDINFAFTY